MAKLEKQVTDLTAAMNRKGKADSYEKQEIEEKALAERKSAFDKYMRKGEGRLNAEELKAIEYYSEAEKKALSSFSDQDGGFLVTPTMSDEIVKKQFETSEMRPVASVMTISSE